MKELLRHRTLQLLLLLGGSIALLASSGNPPNARTGAPFDGHCNGCHGGNNPSNFNGSITLEGMPASIAPNTIYPLTLRMTATAGNPNKGGFQLVVVDGASANCGDLTASNAETGTEFANTREYIEHRNTKNFAGNGSDISWNFNWKSPVTASGNLAKVYFIGNFANGSGSNGDFMLIDNASYSFQPATSTTAEIIASTNVSCFGGNNGNATVQASGGSGAFTYLWSNGQTAATAVNLAAATYTVTVSSTGSPTATAVAVITQPSALTLSLASSNALSCNNSFATITGSPGGGTPSYTYSWSSGATGNPIQVFATGTYTATITDGNGCTKTASVAVTGNITPPNAVAVGSVIACGASSAAVSGMGSSAGANITYLWTAPPGRTILSGASAINATVSGTGVYTLQVTNTTNGCTATATASVTASAPPAAVAMGGVQPCNGNITISGAGSSTGANISYLWTAPAGGSISAGATTLSATVSGAGVYTLVVTNINTSCTASATATVTTAVPPVAVATGGTQPCSGNTTVSGTGSSTGAGFVYLWTPPMGGTVVSGGTTLTATVSGAGIYTLVVSNTSNGCTASATATVTATGAPGVTAMGANLTCAIPSATISANSPTNGVSYTWSGPSFTSNLQNPIVTTAGTYTVVVTAPGSVCTSSAAVQVTENVTAPTVSLSAGSLSCTTVTTTIVATTNSVEALYQWSGPGIVSGNATGTITINQPGTYTVTVTNPVNGCTTTESVAVTQDIAPPTATIAPPTALNCNIPAVTLNANASSQGTNFTYLWSGPSIASGNTTLQPMVNAPGIYTLVVTNNTNGCTASASVAVIQNSAIIVSITNVSPVACFGGNNGTASATATGGTGGYFFLWSNGFNGSTPNNFSAGNYQVTVTDNSGCSGTAAVIIGQPATPLTVNATATPILGAGQSNGSATANPQGGSNPYTYLWSTASTTVTIENLAVGAYTVTVTDFRGCTAIQTVNVNAFNCSFAATISSTNISCAGLSNGTASVAIQNAVVPVIYQWSNQQFTQNITGLAAGLYTVTATDATNCPVVLSATITSPTPLMVGVTTTSVSGNGINDGTATATANGGTVPYTYLWSTLATTPTISGLAPGAYTVTVTDANNCSVTQTAFVSAFNCTGVSVLSITNANCFGSSNGAAVAFFMGAVSPFSYNWSNGANTAGISALAAGSYTVTMTDAAGCAIIDTAVITQPAQLVGEVTTINNVACPNIQGGSVVISVTGGGTPSYSFTYPPNSQPLLGIGIYNVTVTNPNGCTTVVPFSIIAIDTVPPVATCPSNIAACDTGNFTNFGLPMVTDNCLPLGLQYDIIEGLPNGSYFPEGTTLQVFRVTDGSGNSTTCSFTITTYPTPDVQIVSIKNDINGSGIGSIDITPVGGTMPFSYTWYKDNVVFAMTGDLNGLSSGNYRLVMVDANGCEVALAPINIQNVVGTAIAFEQAGIQIWPNPVTDQQELQIIWGAVKGISLQIMNMNGQLLVNDPNLLGKNTIEIGGLANGMYIVVVTDQYQRRYFTRFIKQ